MRKLSAKAIEQALISLRAECSDGKAVEFTPKQVAELIERMRAEMKDGPLLLTGRKGRATD